jgi:hypothetical protein
MDSETTIRSDAAEVCQRVADRDERPDRGRGAAERPAYLRQPDAIDRGCRA